MISNMGKTTFVLLVLSALVSTPARSDEFRVESKVYSSEKTRPISQSLTLFRAGRVYDLLSLPPEITIFDVANSRIVMIDSARQIRTEMETGELITFVEQLRIRASRQVDPLLKFAAEPKFAETVDDDGRLSFVSHNLSYRIRGTRATSPVVAQAYREFADWSARLSARVLQGAQPPFPRLAVNAALERRGLLPEEVERSTSDSNRPKALPVVLHSEHKFEAQLYPADLKRIEEADKFAKDFEMTPLDQYLHPSLQAKR
ncbi:MAG: hypothetical protein IT427_03960 [Pirellulales bacterium]|nr:hypothetical protein [Pirellulales bacterium]